MCSLAVGTAEEKDQQIQKEIPEMEDWHVQAGSSMTKQQGLSVY